MADEIDQKLARFESRLKAGRAQVRSRLEAAPELLELLGACKEKLGGRLKFVRIGEWSQGTEPEIGAIVNVYGKPEKKPRGK